MHPADLTYLRFDQFLGFVFKDLSTIEFHLDNGWVDFSFIDAAHNNLISLDEMDYIITLVQSGKDGPELDEMVKTYFTEIKGCITDILAKSVAYHGFAVNNRGTTDEKTLKILKDSLEEIKKGAEYIMEERNKLNAIPQFKNYIETGKIRSKRMNKAAKKNGSNLGVWKIGEAHVKDIKSILREEQSPFPPNEYNLVCMKSYKDEYSKWKSLQPKS